MRFKIFYKGNTNIIVKKETYRMGESSPNPKTIDYYDEAQRVYKSESFYPRLTTLKYNRKAVLILGKHSLTKGDSITRIVVAVLRSMMVILRYRKEFLLDPARPCLKQSVHLASRI